MFVGDLGNRRDFDNTKVIAMRFDFAPAPGLEIGLNRALQLCGDNRPRSEEHTSELQSLMRNSYAGFCLKTKMQKIIRATLENNILSHTLALDYIFTTN